MASLVTIKTALISVSKKDRLLELGALLRDRGVKILSTGGTAVTLRQAGIAVTDVSEHTGSPEILDGRVKTLHPKIHGGILGRSTPEHQKVMAEQGISPIDLVVVNLYPFEETAARAPQFDELVEQIDIGGPAMVRSAAKNHERVTVIVDPQDYEMLATELGNHNGATSADFRFRMAKKAFAHTAAYDAAIANVLGGLDDSAAEKNDKVAPDRLPSVFSFQADAGQKLRYGENPHQKAAVYRTHGEIGGIAAAQVLQGKELSYNNWLDLDAATGLVAEFSDPAVVVIKHNNPCGAAESRAGLLEAWQLALACDPVSAFGGIVATNREIDGKLATQLAEIFLECIAAPSYSTEALEILAKKKSLRLLTFLAHQTAQAPLQLRSISGGLLLQTQDTETGSVVSGRVVTKKLPTTAEKAALEFAWRVCKHVKSNAIIFARPAEGGYQAFGIGAGQMSRIDSVRLAVGRSRFPVQGAVMASDAFFPFRDGIDAAYEAGIVAVAQPGGSVRDDEVIAACDEHGMSMVLTGIRHFRH